MQHSSRPVGRIEYQYNHHTEDKTMVKDKPEDLGFMYSHSFVDPDGHGWGIFHMSDTTEQK
jgi:predicted lactoylglutathione lyase